jgi:hypothetical protein
MPNRKTLDPREKYDHSGRSLEHAQKNDLKPDINEEDPRPGRDPLDPRDTGVRRGKARRAAGR